MKLGRVLPEHAVVLKLLFTILSCDMILFCIKSQKAVYSQIYKSCALNIYIGNLQPLIFSKWKSLKTGAVWQMDKMSYISENANLLFSVKTED